ncbi:MAG: hypothetical protein NPINA01_29070 [Nitrospinaceae bacterium]|nr:MAG: hypothetical protein NPINA01_29070 [Nitrospinaceae bacterium]
MKKPILIFFSVLLFSLAANTGHAREMNPSNDISDKAVAMDQKASGTICAKKQLEKAALENGNPELPFMLQRDLKTCLEKCSQEYDSCVSGAGDNAGAQFRCGEKRWMCTRSCDDAFAPQLEL